MGAREVEGGVSAGHPASIEARGAPGVVEGYDHAASVLVVGEVVAHGYRVDVAVIVAGDHGGVLQHLGEGGCGDLHVKRIDGGHAGLGEHGGAQLAGSRAAFGVEEQEAIPRAGGRGRAGVGSEYAGGGCGGCGAWGGGGGGGGGGGSAGSANGQDGQLDAVDVGGTI